jgi:transposase
MQAHQKAGFCRVNIDECGFSHDMPRQYGYALVGQRCAGKQNWHAKGRTNVIGALLGSRLLTVSLFNGSINADAFSAWVAQDLLPQLPPRCVVVMDNAAFHKRADILELFQQAGHLLEYLPPYSPDLNPIEHKWAQAKAIRKQKNCSVEDLFIYYL